jgi:hypothetical protein
MSATLAVNAEDLPMLTAAQDAETIVRLKLASIFEPVASIDEAELLETFSSRINEVACLAACLDEELKAHIAGELRAKVSAYVVGLSLAQADPVKLHSSICTLFNSSGLQASDIHPRLVVKAVDLDVPCLIAAVWHDKALSARSDWSESILLEDLYDRLMVNKGPRKHEIRLALKAVDAEFGTDLRDREKRLMDAIKQRLGLYVQGLIEGGGIEALHATGVDLRHIFEVIFRSWPKESNQTLFDNLQFLRSLVEFMHDKGLLSAEERSRLFGRMLKAGLSKVGSTDYDKTPIWAEFIKEFAPHAPETLTPFQFISLIRATFFAPNPLWRKPLAEFIKKEEFKRMLKRHVPGHLKLEVVDNLGLDKLFKRTDRFKIGGLRPVLQSIVTALNAGEGSKETALKDAIEAANGLIEEKVPYPDVRYERSLMSFVPYMTSQFGELILISMAKLILNPPLELKDITPSQDAVRWPEDLTEELDKDVFKSALTELAEPCEHQGIVRFMGCTDFYTRAALLKMGGVRISQDLGL